MLAGPLWYEGPDFEKRHEIYAAARTFEGKSAGGGVEKVPGFEGALGSKNEYSDNFIAAAHDFNGDGRPDYLVVGFPGKETFWYENPGEKGGLWDRHIALASTDNESPMFVDLDGDARPDLLCMNGGRVGYASFDPENQEAEWKFHAVSPVDEKAYQRFSHGIGHGDLDGDGREDILGAKGWWEQPANWDGKTPWAFHPADFGKGGAQMFGYDVNDDGRMDVITALQAHGFGLAWFEQMEDGSWARHLLTDTADENGATGVAFSQPHALELADIDGDGLLDLVSGKRFWAHGPEGDVEPGEAAVVYVFLLKREGGKGVFRPVLVHADSGVGCQVSVADLDQDGRPDLITSNKKGLFIHLQTPGKP